MPAPTVFIKIRVKLPNGSRAYLDPTVSSNSYPLCPHGWHATISSGDADQPLTQSTHSIPLIYY